MSSGSDVVSVVADVLHREGLPMESAVKFAHVSVEAVRSYLWRVMPCGCDEIWTVRSLRDPSCSAHDYDLELDGDGDGRRLTPDRQREQLMASAVRLREQYGDEVYRDVFAPAYAKLLASLNGDG